MQRFKKVRQILLIFIGIYSLFLIFALGGLTNWFQLRTSTHQNKLEYTAHPPDLQISLNLFPPTEAGSKPRIAISYLSYYLPENSTDEPNELCLDEIKIAEYTQQSTSETFGFNSFPDELFPYCVSLERGTKIGKVSINEVPVKDYFSPSGNFEKLGELELQINADNFLYPYDSFAPKIGLQIKYRLLDDGKLLINEVASPRLSVTNQPNIIEWDIKISGKEEPSTSFHPDWLTIVGMDDVKQYRTLDIAFARPLILQLTYPIIIGSLLLLVALLARVQSLDTFMEGSVAVLLGIFGLKELLLPPDIKVRTILDIAILGLYVTFAFALARFLLTLYFQTQRDDAQSTAQETAQPENSSSQISNPPVDIPQNTTPSRPITSYQNPVWLIAIGIGTLVFWLISRDKERKPIVNGRKSR